MTKQSTNTPQQSLRMLIADDAYAMAFQTVGQYRSTLLQITDSINREPQAGIVEIVAEGAPPAPGIDLSGLVRYDFVGFGGGGEQFVQVDTAGYYIAHEVETLVALDNQPAPAVPAGDIYMQKLEKALRPFAKLAKPFEGNFDTDHIMQDFRGTLTVRHIRAAAKALAHQPAQEQVQPTPAELVHALRQAERLLRAAGFAMTGTASSQIVAAIAAHATAAQQAAAPALHPALQSAFDLSAEAWFSARKLLEDDEHPNVVIAWDCMLKCISIAAQRAAAPCALDGWDAAAKALAERAAGHFRNKDFELQDECLQCASMLHDMKPVRIAASTPGTPEAPKGGVA